MGSSGGNHWRTLPLEGPISPEDKHKIRAHLATVLRSNAFRASPRCQEFLSHVVELALAGKRDELKERLIGVHLFGRDVAYDTGEDPIVRVKANEVRKRLAQNYEECGTPDGVKIVLPAGTYVPQFLLVADSAPPRAAGRIGKSLGRLLRGARRTWGGLTLAALIVGAGLYWWARPDPLDRFWAPLLDAQAPLLVSLGTSEIVRLSPEAAQALASTGQDAVTLQRADIAVARNEFISLAHFRGLLEIYQFCQRHGKPIEFRPGEEISAEELRGAPILFVGAFSNAWTIRLNSDLRFRFERVPPAGLAIVEAGGGRSWKVGSPNPKSVDVDYALVTRLVATDGQGPRIAAGGLTRFGTQAALDFLSQPDYWKNVARHLPAGWPRRNLQLVLRVSIVSGSHQPAVLVASHAW
ncbi:MAG: hypothetical protein RMK57_07275 [Bryobacterales bacterium]|nr:hypothetical protein [Bryobacteraceae bacterium]MDW8354316.1 hypothetical protein [Bryobacterales bacterium]